MNIIKLIVVDDHRVVRDGLREMIRGRPDIQIVSEAADGDEALLRATEVEADMMILDITLPSLSGIEVLKHLRESGLSMPVLFFSMHPADQYADYLFKIGAQGFLSKEATTAELLAAIDDVHRGQCHFSTLNIPLKSGSPDILDTLSKRERQVALGILKGEPQTEIARELNVTNKSIGTYRLRILNKLGVHNNAELIALVTRLRLSGEVEVEVTRSSQATGI